MNNKSKWKIHVVPQTHWDKEWYFTKSTATPFLIEMINKIYDFYFSQPNNTHTFVLDGQFSLIDDYCKLGKSYEKKINWLIKNKKIIIGPFYTQNDTINVLGESIVRNLLTGIENSLRLDSLHKTAYIPDTFGFNSNLPQILKDANLNYMVFWRGVNESQLKGNALNEWVGIDNTSIISYNLFKWGYGIGVEELYPYLRNPNDFNFKKMTLEYLRVMKEKYIPILKTKTNYTNNHILLPFGSDQMPMFEKLNEFLKILNQNDNENEWLASNYDKYFLDSKIEHNKLNVIQGELRYGQYSRVHRSITSVRYDIKYLSKKIEYKLYYQMEPLALMYNDLFEEYPTEIIEDCSKKILESQAHDSIGGCNSDETNNEILQRLNSVEDVMDGWMNLAKRQMCENILINNNEELIIFNLEPFDRKLNGNIKIISKFKDFYILDEKNQYLKILKTKQCLYNNQKFEIIEENNCEHTLGEKDFYLTELKIQTDVLKKFSINRFKIIENNLSLLKKTEKKYMENNFYKIVVTNNCIDLKIKSKNILIKKFLNYSCLYNEGDLYDFSPNVEKFYSLTDDVKHKILEIQEEQFFSRVIIESKYFLRDLNIYQNILTTISLNDKDIEIITDIKNKVPNIKWTLDLKTSNEINEILTDTAFGIYEIVDKSNLFEKSVLENWEERYYDINICENSFFVKSKDNSMVFSSKGNNEFQILDWKKGLISITLFTSSSLIGKRNLLYRPGRASGVDLYPLSTENSTMKKHLQFNSIVSFYQKENSFVKWGKEYAKEIVYYQPQDYNRFYFKGDNLINVRKNFKNQLSKIEWDLNENLVLSCFKKSVNSNNKIIRFYNPTKESISLQLPLSFKEVNIIEEDKKTCCQLVIYPNQFKTFKF